MNIVYKNFMLLRNIYRNRNQKYKLPIEIDEEQISDSKI